LAEAEWQRATEQARDAAREQRIDQQTIDDAVAELRYGA
jgi:hypothetical protein